ncbi:MAG TPA: S41 family peptidase, partial [Chitinophagales bacterium]|nr:S41 family peptidase [Chitinophagales bacterium]
MYRQLIIQLLMLLLVSPAANAQKKSKEEPPVQLAANARAMQVMMETHHCSPRIKDSQYYKDVAALFLKSLDPLRIYLTQEDVKMINDTVALKDELQGHNQNYSKSIIMLFKERLLGANRQITDIARTPFNFNLNESIFTEEDSIPYAADDKGLRDNMYKLMKFNTLDRIMEGELLDSTLRTTPVEQREPKEREIAAKIRHRRVKQRLETKWGFDNLVNIYLANAVVKAYDPHSEFIPELSDKRNRYMLTASPGAFGLVLKENYKGDVVVAKLIPGSSAWKSGVINKDDVLVHLQWEEDTPIDLEGADLDEVEVGFGSKRYRKLKLTVLKPDGQTRTALLSRGWYYVEGENHVQGYILDGPVKLGYIVLPSFYGDWESVYGSSCARDVDKTIEKMQFQVEGIILDMRNNGGGSLGEANQLAGIFIDEGPLGFRKQRNGFSTEMTDPYLGAQYDGPLVVMVNNESASATEYVAAALQDYN